MSTNKNKLKKTLAVTAGITAAAGATYCASCAYIFTTVFKRKKKVEYLTFSDSLPTKLDNDAWFEACAKNEVELLSYDGLKLHATEIYNDSNKWVLCFHAYSFYGTQVLDVAHEFHQRGYNCLIVDQRAHGKSEGNYSTLGWKEHFDCLDWIDYVVAKNPEASIVLHGTSLGASTVLNATGEFLPSNVKCAVSDCAYSSIEGLLKYQSKKYLKLPMGALIPGVNLLCKSKADFSLYESNSLRQVKQSTTPTLFLHGELDAFAPFEMVFDLFYACDAEKELHTFQEAKHAESFLANDYFEKVFAFVDHFTE